eukprot:CAMPEP_0202060888 /NCGR_PEP_ID=MMETSP0963-20130614/39505_1 /ASSEMBLY_ACC=CAM_ASM_000494 /TAXON_ID=4773 /ORGANISM="Schizochytrium aggregatum, Strain ATCC28209" /LENGTH=126 /DNA_ID=CAMNT_0048627039 /DNA_START=281 /DNA_END=659 /DNA_ORIENTATION=-
MYSILSDRGVDSREQRFLSVLGQIGNNQGKIRSPATALAAESTAPKQIFASLLQEVLAFETLQNDRIRGAELDMLDSTKGRDAAQYGGDISDVRSAPALSLAASFVVIGTATMSTSSTSSFSSQRD